MAFLRCMLGGAALVALLANSGATVEPDFLISHKLTQTPKVLGPASPVADALAGQYCTYGKAQYVLGSEV